MIRITALGSSLVSVDAGSQTYVNNNGPAAGMVRYNTNSQQFEVFDGNNWQVFYQDINLRFSGYMEDLLQWAEKKRREEQELDQLCANYPNLAEVRQEFEILHRLVKNPKKDV